MYFVQQAPIFAMTYAAITGGVAQNQGLVSWPPLIPKVYMATPNVVVLKCCKICPTGNR